MRSIGRSARTRPPGLAVHPDSVLSSRITGRRLAATTIGRCASGAGLAVVPRSRVVGDRDVSNDDEVMVLVYPILPHLTIALRISGSEVRWSRLLGGRLDDGTIVAKIKLSGAPTDQTGRAMSDVDYLRRILNAQVYDVAVETPLETAPGLSRPPRQPRPAQA